MSSERGRAIVIFAAVAVVAAAGGYYFFGVYRPKEMKSDARDEVAAWEQRWSAASACLLGAEPGSPKTSEALAIHELSPDPWDSGTCTALVAKLTRGDAANTGIAEVETAWRALDAAAAKAAQAFALRAERGASSQLASALDALDDARGHLREIVDLPPQKNHAAPLAAAQYLPLASGDGTPTDAVFIYALPSAAGMISPPFGDSHAQIAIAVGQPPHVWVAPRGGSRATPDASWGAAIDVDHHLVAGALGSDGGMASPQQLGSAARVFAAAGTLADGAVIYDDGTASSGLDIAVARIGSGAIAHDPVATVPAEDVIVIAEPSGRTLVMWAADHQFSARVFTGAAASPAWPLDLANPRGFNVCFSGDRAWLATGGKLTAIDAGGVQALADDRETAIGCSRDGLIAQHDGSAWSLCSGSGDNLGCSPLALARGVPSDAALTTLAGKPIAIALHGPVVAVWRGTDKPTFYSTPAGVPPAATPRVFAAWTDGKVVDMLVGGRNGSGVLRVAL